MSPQPEASSGLETYIYEVRCTEVVTRASGVDDNTQGECLLAEERRAWESREANGYRKEDESAITREPQEANTNRVELQEPQESVSRGKEWSAVSDAAEKVKD